MEEVRFFLNAASLPVLFLIGFISGLIALGFRKMFLSDIPYFVEYRRQVTSGPTVLPIVVWVICLMLGLMANALITKPLKGDIFQTVCVGAAYHKESNLCVWTEKNYDGTKTRLVATPEEYARR
jgi:hypothetical protein